MAVIRVPFIVQIIVPILGSSNFSQLPIIASNKFFEQTRLFVIASLRGNTRRYKPTSHKAVFMSRDSWRY